RILTGDVEKETQKNKKTEALLKPCCIVQESTLVTRMKRWLSEEEQVLPITNYERCQRVDFQQELQRLFQQQTLDCTILKLFKGITFTFQCNMVLN
ncbi:mCG145568, partial [Mus musculus]